MFAETGLVVTPFLPGDSLLFAAGALAATGASTSRLCCVLLAAAAILGNTVNYAVGRYRRPARVQRDRRPAAGHRLLNREHLDRTHAFFERYGGKAVVLGRFVPIVRTFVPFVAGAGAMTYPTFALYNVVGGLAWVGVCFGGRVRVRQRAGDQEQLLARRPRHRGRFGDADRDRDDPAPLRRDRRAVRAPTRRLNVEFGAS